MGTGGVSPPLRGETNALRERGFNDGTARRPMMDVSRLTPAQQEAYRVGYRAAAREAERLARPEERARWLNDDPTRNGGRRNG